MVSLTIPSAKTPDLPPWSTRASSERRHRPGRSAYDIDRDRIIHSATFRELQYKTQVQGLLDLTKPRLFRTRLNHVLEVAQIARGLARAVGADEPLSEATALAHDLGHPPFGHAGERALRDSLKAHGREGWNANVHSLDVVDRIEVAFAHFRGLNLTYATREGIARHSTPFDEPVSFGEFAQTPQGGLECQIVDVSDVFAYLSHDLDDAISGRYVTSADLNQIELVRELFDDAEADWDSAGLQAWPEEERGSVVRKRVIAKLVSRLVAGTSNRTTAMLLASDMNSAESIREFGERVVAPSDADQTLVQDLLRVLSERYYRSDDVREADNAAHRLIVGLMEALIESPSNVPARLQTGDSAIDAAAYLASLNDFTAADLGRRLGIAA
jgi:dGTPase